MIKRFIDVAIALLGLLVTSPLLLPVMFLVWWQDKHSPFYVAPRVGKGGSQFSMIKLRSMTLNADQSGVDSTSSNDTRITPIGQFIRSYKLDEITQLWNVLLGDMSLVGPRPNVKRETDLYTTIEKRLLQFKPGITDISSIVFSDEGEILAGQPDPDITYNQLIRPYKSRLSICYVDHSSITLDVRLMWWTGVAFINRRAALNGITAILHSLSVDRSLIEVAKRVSPLIAVPPPGASEIVTSREA